MATISPEIQETLKLLPEKPGVYQMKNRDGIIIYIGKARILRNRVRSYFTGKKDTKTSILVQHIASISFIVTNTEYEALILENNLIKEHSPKYNINLKDGKTYPVIRITKEEYPRIFRTRRMINDGSSYFGPFTAVDAIDTYLDLIEKHFPLRKCRGPLKKRDQPCLYYHIHRCTAPCAGLASPRDYKASVNSIKDLLEGRTATLQKRLDAQMLKQSKALQFEEAARTRDAIRALQTISQAQQVQDFDPESRDYIAWHQDEDRLCVVVFSMREGKLIGTDRFRVHSWHDASDELESILLQYYQTTVPGKIVLGGLETYEAINIALRNSTGKELEIRPPSSSKDEAILGMALENARQELSRWKTETGDIQALQDLRDVLELPSLPLRIEGFDVAQLQGKHTVTAMVSFWKGIPDKNKYRIFKIRSLQGAIDDYESLREALARRYTRVLNEELERPDLILIDGGKGQLNAALGILRALGLEDIPLCSLAKEEEELFVPRQSQSLRLPYGSPALRLLQAVRDESHRFGTTRNQKLRSKDIKFETLEAIPGIGPGRAKKMMTLFGSLEGIARSSVDEIVRQARIPPQLAQTILESLADHAYVHTSVSYDDSNHQDAPIMAAESPVDTGEDE